MFFKRRSQGEEATEGQTRDALTAGDDRASVLHEEFGLYHLWYLERRLSEEIVRAGRTDNVFSLVGWQLRLLPGEYPGACKATPGSRNAGTTRGERGLAEEDRLAPP